MQNIYGKERDHYTGVTARYIRLTIQRLVLILPVEEQQSLPEILEIEVEMAKEACGVKEKVDLQVKVNAGSHSVMMRSNMVVAMLKQKGDFDQAVGRYADKEEDVKFQGSFDTNYISQGSSQDEGCCGLCVRCREEN